MTRQVRMIYAAIRVRLASFLHKTTLPVPQLGSFCVIFGDQIHPPFCVISSWQAAYAFRTWLRFVKSTLVGELHPNLHLDPPSRIPITPIFHTPILSQFRKYRMRTLEGLEGLEAFLFATLCRAGCLPFRYPAAPPPSPAQSQLLKSAPNVTSRQASYSFRKLSSLAVA